MTKNSRKKELINEYKNSHRRMGVYQIRNIVNDKALVGGSLDLMGIFNRQKFQLGMGNHWNKKLQAEWEEYGSEKFVFEILDELAPRNEAGYDYRADVAFLEEQWLEQIKPYGDRGYNEREKTREEKLRAIAEKRRE